MKTVLINSCNFGSTGNIMLEIAETAENGGYTAAVCYPQSRDNSRKQKEKEKSRSSIIPAMIWNESLK